jgi:predicted NBD/HSP70 family sugar kinase
MKIGIDIGGTTTTIILLKGQQVVDKIKEKSPQGNWEEYLISLIKKIKQNNSVTSIGMAIPGALNENKDTLEATPNTKGIVGINFKKLLNEEFGSKVLLENDANCFTLAEAKQGAGQGYKNILGLTLGTGLGSGLILNNKLFHGSFGTAPEAGHMIVKAGGAKCGCGSRGCFEQYASSRFFLNQFSQNPITAFKKAREKDPQALKAWQYFGYWLGLGIGNLVNIIEPEIVILGGEMTHAWDFFIQETQKAAQEHIYSPLAKKGVKIIRSQVGYLAGAIGAALLSEES